MSEVGAPERGSPEERVSLFALGSLVLRHRYRVLRLAILGTVLGVLWAVLSKREYVSSAIFVPQGAETGMSGLELAASQFGIRVPTSSGPWTPTLYAVLLESRVLLERLAVDTVVVEERNGERVPVMELLEVEGRSPAEHLDRAVRKLSERITAREVKALAAVRLSVSTYWPSVSRAMADRLIESVNDFNLSIRQSQASAERHFIETQLEKADNALRASEDRLLAFRKHNRVIAAPELVGESERLQREVSMRTQVYTSLVQALDEARIREVRNTPVITIIEQPHTPVRGQPRKTIQRGIIGGILGGVLAILMILVSDRWAAARRTTEAEGQEFFRLLDSTIPRFFRSRYGALKDA